MLRVYTADLCL